jgi:hypothetical protein
MSTNHNIPGGNWGKDNELKKVYLSFSSKPKTMKEADVDTGIMRESICWYCRHLRLNGLLHPIGKRSCHVTKHEATVWTTDPNLIPVSPQLKFW